MPVLNRVRLICKEADRGSIHVKSNLDGTYQLDHRIDEDIAFIDEGVVAVQNKRADPCVMTVKVIRAPDRIIFLRPSRQVHVQLLDPEASQVRSEVKLTLAGGETCVITSSEFKGRTGGGAAFPV